MSVPAVGKQPGAAHGTAPSSSPTPGGVGAVRDSVAPAQNQEEPPGVFERGVRAFFGKILVPIWNFIARIFRPIGNFFISVKNKIAGWFSSPKPPEPPAVPPQPQQQQPSPTPPPPAPQPPAAPENNPFKGTGWTAESLLQILLQKAIPADPNVLFHIFEAIVSEGERAVIYQNLGQNGWVSRVDGKELLKKSPLLLGGYLIGPLEAYIKTH